MKAACGRPLCLGNKQVSAMKLFIRILIFCVLACTDLCRPCHADSLKAAQIHRLVIESKTLPDRDRRQVVRQFEGRDYWVLEELGEQIRMAFRNLGYFTAVVDEPTISPVTSGRGKRIADVTVRVKAGAQYRLGEIHFRGARTFPGDRLRTAFEQQKGDVLNATEFGEGLEHLRTLYGTAGYADVSAVPNAIADESRHVISFTIDIQEGWISSFGRLILDGPEPHTGAGYALMSGMRCRGEAIQSAASAMADGKPSELAGRFACDGPNHLCIRSGIAVCREREAVVSGRPVRGSAASCPCAARRVPELTPLNDRNSSLRC